jgi:hypothetical protein
MRANAVHRMAPQTITPAIKSGAIVMPLTALAPAPIGAVMHPHVYRIALGCWVVFLSIFWMTFWFSANALFMVVVGTFYATVFFGVPYMMLRQMPGGLEKRGSLVTFLDLPFATNSGTIHGYEALLQVILVPVCLILGGTVIGFIIHWAKALP